MGYDVAQLGDDFLGSGLRGGLVCEECDCIGVGHGPIGTLERFCTENNKGKFVFSFLFSRFIICK
jgi:hypothetical protein